MQTFYGTRISEHISESPEGFLICHSAPLARTATRVPQQYRADELGLPSGDLVDVYRSPQEVLAKKFLASLEGKPITDGHPPQFLSAANVGWYSRGHVQNVRPGPRLPDGEQAVIGDLVITDPGLIAKIRAGVRELSIGYVYDVDEDNTGKISQRNLAANHVAVVPDGRAGQHVRIMDAAPEEDFAAVCAAYHRAIPSEVAGSRSKVRHATDALKYDPTGQPKSFDELGAELSALFNAEKMIEARRTKSIVSGDEDMANGINREECERLINSIDRLTVIIERQGLPNKRTGNAERPAQDGRSTDPAEDLERMAARYHRRYFHIRSDREDLPAEEGSERKANDAAETFDESVARQRQRLLKKKY